MSGIEPLLTAQEAAEILKVSTDKVHALADAGVLRSIRLTPRTLRFHRHEVDEYRTSVAPLMPWGNLPSPHDDLLGAVYFVQSGEFVKIGFTAKPLAKRMRHLQTGNPVQMKKLYALLNVESRFEKLLHKMFAGVRHREEWFAGHRDMLHPSGDKAFTIVKFAEALAKDEAGTLEEFKINWRRGP